MVFSSSAQTVSISDSPSTFSVYSSLTTDQHITDLINDASASTSKVYSSSKMISTFPVINDASASTSKVYSSVKVDALISSITGQSFSSNVFPFRVDTVTGLNVPSGYLRYDNVVQTASPYLRFSWYTAQAVDVKRFMLTTVAPSNVIIFDANNTNNYQIFTVTGFVTTGVSGGAWVTFPVTFANSGGTGTTGFALDTPIIMGIQAEGTVGATGAQGSPGLSSSLFEYTLDRNSIVIGSGVGNGDIRFNNADLTLATTIWIDNLDDFGNDVERFVAQLADGSQVIIQDKNNSGNFAIYDVDSSSLVAGSYVALTVVYDSGAGLASLVNTHPVFLALQFSVSQTFAVGTTTTLSAGSSATVSNSGTQNDIVLNFGIPQGATGAPGSPGTSADLEFTIIQFSYYGSTPTVNSFNLASGSISNAGGSLGLPAQSGSTRLTQAYRVRSNVASTANGAVSGWLGNSSSPQVFIGSGWKLVFSFGLEDTTTNALTRTFIGIQQTPSVNTLNNTTTVQSLTVQSLCIMQESGESTFSFYSRGASSFSKIATSIPCTTPSVGWYTLVLHNDAGSNDVIMTLKYVAIGSVIQESTTITCGTTSAPVVTSACYAILQRNMSSAGGVTGSAILSLGGVKMLLR